MPQLDASTFPSQLFWLTVSFILLYLLMARFVVPRVQEVLDARQGRLTDDLDHAARYKREAETVQAAYERALAEARARAQTQMAEMTKEIETQANAKNHALDEVLAKKVADSDAAIANARASAKAKLAPVVEELTAMIVEKLIHRRPQEQEVSAAVSDVTKGKKAA